MIFLSTDAKAAAHSLCDQDAAPIFMEAMSALLAHNDMARQSQLVRWVREDGANYHWLAYFCECLLIHPRLNSYRGRVESLRTCNPNLHSHSLTPFPYANSIDSNSRPTSERVVGASRAHYVTSRCEHAKWSATPPPTWFFRLACSILDEGQRRRFLLRHQPAGHSGPDNQGSFFPQRIEVRDGPVGEITGSSGDLFILW